MPRTCLFLLVTLILNGCRSERNPNPPAAGVALDASNLLADTVTSVFVPDGAAAEKRTYTLVNTDPALYANAPAGTRVVSSTEFGPLGIDFLKPATVTFRRAIPPGDTAPVHVITCRSFAGDLFCPKQEQYVDLDAGEIVLTCEVDRTCVIAALTTGTDVSPLSRPPPLSVLGLTVEAAEDAPSFFGNVIDLKIPDFTGPTSFDLGEHVTGSATVLSTPWGDLECDENGDIPFEIALELEYPGFGGQRQQLRYVGTATCLMEPVPGVQLPPDLQAALGRIWPSNDVAAWNTLDAGPNTATPHSDPANGNALPGSTTDILAVHGGFVDLEDEDFEEIFNSGIFDPDYAVRFVAPFSGLGDAPGRHMIVMAELDEALPRDPSQEGDVYRFGLVLTVDDDASNNHQNANAWRSGADVEYTLEYRNSFFGILRATDLRDGIETEVSTAAWGFVVGKYVFWLIPHTSQEPIQFTTASIGIRVTSSREDAASGNVHDWEVVPGNLGFWNGY